MKVIFLDIDGVLVTGETVNLHVRIGEHGFNPFAKGPVFQLNRILAATGAEIVVSSSWRCDGPRWEALMDHFKGQGIDKRPIGRTAHLSRMKNGVWQSPQRGTEIKAWLSNDVQQFVALDDDSDMDDIPNNFIHTKNGMWRGGLLGSHAEAAIEILNQPKATEVA